MENCQKADQLYPFVHSVESRSLAFKPVSCIRTEFRAEQSAQVALTVRMERAKPQNVMQR